MGQLARILRFSSKVLTNRKYRNHVLDVVTRHVQAADGQRPADTLTPIDHSWLAGRRVYIVGGCELTYVKDGFEALGAVVHHTFDHGGSPDPLGEVSNAESPLWTFQPQYVVLSQAQLFRGLVQRVQMGGLGYSREEMDADLKALVGSVAEAVRRIRASASCPVFLMTYTLVHRPAYGVHDYASLKAGRGVAELTRLYDLALYELARETAGVYVLDVSVALERVGKNGHIDETVSDGMYEHFTREGGARLTAQLLYQMEALEPNRRRVKCLAVDLDGTLWTGVLREDGPSGVAVRQSALRVLNQLTSRGVVLAICSKNDEVEAENLPSLLGEELWDKIVARRLNWTAKSQNLRALAKELNIGLDAMAFVDDNPFEREEVRANAPEVLVLSELDLLGTLNRSEFEPFGEVTAEGSARTRMYSEQASREAAATEAGSLEDFLRTCALRLTLRRPASGEMSRVHELLQRTNQLNATLRRSSAADLQEYFADPSRYHMTVALLRDKFGDYGLIGLAAAEKERDAWNILELAFSCRAMGKGVEEALLQHVGEEAGREGVPVLRLDFRRTDRNGQLLTLLERAGFRPAGPESQEILPLSRTRGGPDVPTSFPDWLEIVH